MAELFTIDYIFRFRGGETRNFRLELDEDSLSLHIRRNAPLPPWVALNFRHCPDCLLDPALNPFCPIACHLAEVVEAFRDHNSYDEVSVEVRVKERSYLKETTLQDGLGSLAGVIMATGGCPVLDLLKPMARFHLPFATVEETEFRMISMYLVAQYILQARGGEADWSLEGLAKTYARIERVNRSFVERIRAASVNDAGVNAIVRLDCFAKSIPVAVRTMMREYEHYFAPYFRHIPD
ncbi:MAG: hypothetical protein HYS23_00075 [Geobacter sp.]|nr:hypothetical protein [Geobacter sp.]